MVLFLLINKITIIHCLIARNDFSFILIRLNNIIQKENHAVRNRYLFLSFVHYLHSSQSRSCVTVVKQMQVYFTFSASLFLYYSI